MDNSVVNNAVQQPSKGKKAAGFVAGLTVSGAVKQGVSMASQSVLMPNMKKIGQGLTEAEFGQIKDAIKVITDKTQLAQKGVDIITVNSKNAQQVQDMIAESLSKKFKILPKEAFSVTADMMTDVTKNGENAFFESGLNKIFIGEKKDLATSVFHETGHAMNYNLNKVTKVLQKCRGLQKLALPIALVALLHTDKTNKNGEQSKLNKAGGFVKKHAGSLTFLSFIPTLAEEGLASLKGAKVAKQMVDPALLKKINKSNLLGFASYALMAVAASVGIHLAVKVADKIRAPKKNTELQHS